MQQALCLRLLLLLVWKGSGWRLSELGATGSGAVGGAGGSGEGGKAARTPLFYYYKKVVYRNDKIGYICLVN